MIQSLDQKTVAVTVPVAIVDDGSWTTIEIDTKGYDRLDVYVMLGVLDVDMVAMKLQSTDTTGSGHADVAGLVYDTSPAPDLPSATDDGNIYAFHVDLLGKKRFFDLVLTGGDGTAGTFAVAWAVLSRPKITPITAAARGLAAAAVA